MAAENLDKLLDAIDKDDLETARQLVTSITDLNVPCADLQGAPPLYFAILKGNSAMVRLLLEQGANPNFHAEGLASEIYDDNPLGLARGARFLMNWDLYHQIVLLLEEFGAVDEDPQSPEEFEVTKAEARRFQSQK